MSKKKSTKKTDKNQLQKVKDLRAAPYNPRAIDPEAMSGLRASIKQFGDIGGIVWNARTGNLVTGHQRVKELVEDGAELVPGQKPYLKAKNREVFRIRVVDWDEETEKAANVSANNPMIAGDFTFDLEGVLESLKEFNGFEELRLGDIPDTFAGLPSEGKMGKNEGAGSGLEGADTYVTIGEFRFKVAREEYREWVETIRQDVGFEKETIIREIRKRLEI